MSNELIREKITLEQRIGNESSQILLEGDIIVPDIKPDMSIILQSDPKITIDRIEVSNDRVNFIGRLELAILYLAKGGDKPVHSIKTTTSIDDFINVDGVTKEMWVEAEADITNFDYKMLNDRKISYRAIVNVTVNAQKSEAHNIVVNISDIPSNQLLKKQLNVSRNVENKADRIIIKDELLVPSSKPNIREILQDSATISNKDVRVNSGKVTINGEIVVTVLYRSDDEGLIEFYEHEIPFNSTLDLNGVKDDMIADVNLAVQDLYIQVRPDQDGEDRALEVEISISVISKVSSQETIDILEDAYCINKDLDISKTPVNYPKLVCRNRNQCPIKEIVQIGETSPDILRIFRVKGKPIVDDVKVIEDKVIVEGVIESDTLYLAQSDDTPFYSYRTVIPFRQVIETKGATATPDMEVLMKVTVDHVGFNMLSGREMELRYLLTFNTQVIQERTANMITDIDFLELDRAEIDKMASMTVYVVQPNDTLWKIAKRYNTSLDDILAVNDIDNPDKIFAGQKLLILKKILVG